MKASSLFWRWSQEAPVGEWGKESGSGERSQGMERRHWRVYHQAGYCCGPLGCGPAGKSWERVESCFRIVPSEGYLSINPHSSLVGGCSPGDTNFSSILILPGAWAEPTPASRKYFQLESGRCLQQEAIRIQEMVSHDTGQGDMRRAWTGSATHRYCEFSSRWHLHHFQEAVAISRNRFTSNEFFLLTPSSI